MTERILLIFGMILFNTQNENDEIVCLQNKRINNKTTQN